MQLISKQDFPLFAAFIWHIWNTRNSILFSKSGVPNNVEEFVYNYLQDYNEAQQNNLAGHSVSVSNQRTHHSQLFLVEDFHEDSSALYVDAALDHKHGLTGIGFTFKIGHHQIVASENRLLPVSKVKGDWQDHSALSGLVSQIRLFSFTFPEASLKYLPRQFNTAAHCLAKDAIRLREEGHEEFF
uniref:RNase H type-1 domain-containing protein n=1 Tax=Cannabis sativa TaxID=3483 RepID=A0A803NH21_CANSA